MKGKELKFKCEVLVNVFLRISKNPVNLGMKWDFRFLKKCKSLLSAQGSRHQAGANLEAKQNFKQFSGEKDKFNSKRKFSHFSKTCLGLKQLDLSIQLLNSTIEKNT